MRYIIVVVSVFLISCRSAYKAFVPNYSSHSTNGRPDYSDLSYWAAHPWKWDPSDSVSNSIKNKTKDSLVDVFFIYPTTYTGKKDGVNANIDDADINAKTDYTTILYQASVFNQHARIFSPRYRQMHFSQFFIPQEESIASFDTAYSDVKKAFEFYLANYHHDRPLIIAGHSQGALMAEAHFSKRLYTSLYRKRITIGFSN